MQLKKFIPIFDWLPNYNNKALKGDLIAGLTVGVMLIPQGMAYAMIAGLPLIFGLYASTVPLILYALLGTSRQLAVGPVAMVSLLTAAGIGSIANVGPELYILLAITLAFLVGAIQFLLGVFRLGFLVNFLSHPVISGFTSAAALIIGLSQLKHLLGVNIPRSHHVHEILGVAIQKIPEISVLTLSVGIGGVLIIMAIKKWAKAIPAQLAAVLFGILAVWGLGLSEVGVAIVGEVPSGLPTFSLPSFQSAHIESLLPIALTIALVSFMESIAVAKAIQAKHKDYKIESNQELIALGVANLGGSFFQSYPVTGGFSRTAVNDQAGAKTGMAAVFSAILIVLTLLFFTPLFYYLPNAILAAVIMVAVFGLIDYKEAIHLWKSDRRDFAMLIATFVATLALGIELGIGLGVILSLAMVIFRSTRPHTAVLGQVADTKLYRNIKRFPEVLQRENMLILRFDAQLYFANVAYFKNTLEQEIQKRKNALQVLILPANSMYDMDSSAIHALEELVEECNEKNIKLVFTGVRGPVRDLMHQSKLTDKIGKEHFFMSIQDAVDYFDGKSLKKDNFDQDQFVRQTNV